MRGAQRRRAKGQNEDDGCACVPLRCVRLERRRDRRVCGVECGGPALATASSRPYGESLQLRHLAIEAGHFDGPFVRADLVMRAQPESFETKTVTHVT